MKTKFTCHACRVSTKVKLPKGVRSAMGLAMYATHAGMLGVVDTKRGRVSIYCGRACATSAARPSKRSGGRSDR